MQEVLRPRVPPFVLLVFCALVVCAIVIQVPDTFLGQLERNRPLTDGQAGWAYRLIAFFAIVQVLYGGFAVFRIERLQAAREHDAKLAQMAPDRVVASLSRNAAGMVFLTLIYGLATIAITGLRGGFWLFPMLALAQGAWYFREIGQIARWGSFQPVEVVSDPDRGAWHPPGPGHVPALARGMHPPE